MEDLEYIKQETDKLVAEIHSHPLSTDDIRRSFLELILHTFNLYYIQWDTIQSARIIQPKPIPVTKEERYILNVFVNSVVEKQYYQMRSNSNYRNLFLESWSTFEFCLTYLCEELLDEVTKKELLEYDLKEINKTLLKYNLSDADNQKIEKIFYRNHLTHVPVTRKYNKLYSLYKKFYTGNWTEDSAFLEFYGKYRNCMHTNYIYHGKDKEYTFFGITYFFIDSEVVSQNKEATSSNKLDLAIQLKNICRRLFDAIQHPGLLPFPADKVIQPS
ncbi:hypothetical protein [Hymenobacter bucti]|uniref:Apea-like HEPN domain-containing protein n=1 Tax=Hymenobacter bucti TaxID=1844114 RepID=A0ABW4QWC1_9BACT